jgi:hypothetical protein
MSRKKTEIKMGKSCGKESGTFVCPHRDGKKIKMRLLFLLQRKKT